MSRHRCAYHRVKRKSPSEADTSFPHLPVACPAVRSLHGKSIVNINRINSEIYSRSILVIAMISHKKLVFSNYEVSIKDSIQQNVQRLFKIFVSRDREREREITV